MVVLYRLPHMSKILFVQTGGTIDKDYGETNKEVNFEITIPAVKRVLKKVKPQFEYRIVPLIQKDSLDLTDNDRQLIVDICNNSEEKQIIITHGTDTMHITAETLKTLKNKTILLTGSFKPEMFRYNDVDFNIGTAVAAVQLLKPGIYIAMNGIITPFNKIKKDYRKKAFIKIHNA